MGAGRLDARSADGTPLAVWVEGEGPPLVLVHGSMCDHTAFDPLVAELRTTMTTFAMDRRGFGASGDAAGYALEREFEDVAAVVEAVAARTGGPVALWGHSYGAGCAMGGAALTGAVHRLVLYEPGLGHPPYPAGSIEEVEAALAAGDAETALLLVLVGIVGMTDEEVADRAQGVPGRGRLDVPARRLRRALGAGRPAGRRREPSRAAGGDQPGAGGHPRRPGRGARGPRHLAYRSDPAMVADVIREFVSGSAAASGARPGARTRPG
jgi:pimeloyl-ACP methyl ester carboxylesterase